MWPLSSRGGGGGGMALVVGTLVEKLFLAASLRFPKKKILWLPAKVSLVLCENDLLNNSIRLKVDFYVILNHVAISNKKIQQIHIMDFISI